MLLQKLRCFNFKNYTSIKLDFASQLNCIVGANGAGKTNLLDAIHYLCLTKSAFNPIDNQNILHGESQMSVQGLFIKDDAPYEVKCIVHRDQGKIFQTNDKGYERLREHLGRFPVVFTTPYDTEIIQGASEIRRRFIDSILCQTDSNYLQTLAHYQQVIKHRNMLLKHYAGNTRLIDQELIDSYDKQLLPLNKELYKARRSFVQMFYPIFKQHYQYFVDASETVELAYESDVADPSFEQAYINHFYQDMMLHRTALGVHTDDFIFTLNGHPLKKFGSQGQQKSFIIALRLAQFACIYEVLKCKPLLLLDDIFDKLDEDRIEKLIDLITQQHFGQVWITDAGATRSTNIINKIQADKALFRIDTGKLVERAIV